MSTQSQDAVINVTIASKDALYRAHMPFVKNGGLFIETYKNYELGADVFILLQLMDEKEKFPIAGKVIWVTPKGAQFGASPGIGVRFVSEDAKIVHNKIITYLVGFKEEGKMTDTM